MGAAQDGWSVRRLNGAGFRVGSCLGTGCFFGGGAGAHGGETEGTRKSRVGGGFRCSWWGELKGEEPKCSWWVITCISVGAMKEGCHWGTVCTGWGTLKGVIGEAGVRTIARCTADSV